MIQFQSGLNLLPPRVDLKNKPKTPKGKGQTPPMPKQFKTKPIQAEDNIQDSFLKDSIIEVEKKPEVSFNDKLGEAPKKKTNGLKELKGTITISLSSDDWLLTQVTAVSSVILDEQGQVIPETSNFVNTNGNAWSNETLKKHYRSFVGAHNFRDHIAGDKLSDREKNSYGVVIDAILRPLKIDKTNTIYYVDLLIATNRVAHPDWCKKIESGEVRYVSMGCECSTAVCSRCGRKVMDIKKDQCDHLKYELGMYYMKGGIKYKVAELVTDIENKEGESFLEFFEISYLSENPAFRGAAKSHNLDIPRGQSVEVTIPRKYWDKQAFQIWKDYITVVKEN